MSIISKLKVFKQTDPQNPSIYDIGANAENVTYTKEINSNNEINNVKTALNDLYSKIGSSEGSGSGSGGVTQDQLNTAINKLRAQIGFCSTLPSIGEGSNKYLSFDESYKNICYTDIKFKASSASSRELYIGGLLNILDSLTGRSQITENASQLLREEGVLFKRSDRSSWQKLQDSRIEDDTSLIEEGTKIQIQILLQPNIAVYGQIGNNNPEWYLLKGENNLKLTSNEYTIIFNQYHNFTFSITNDNRAIKNITRIGKPLFDANGNFKIPEDRSLAPYLEGEEEQQVSKTALFIDLIYPIGSIYMSLNGTPPNYLFGGVWQKIEGRFLLAQGKYNNNQFFPYSVEEKKGAEQNTLVHHTHTLTKTSKAFSITSSKEANHKHSLGEVWSDGSGSKSAYVRSSSRKQQAKETGGAGAHNHTVKIGANEISDNLTITFNQLNKDNVNGIETGVFVNPGLGNNVGNLPPYLVVYMWTRVA